MPTFPFTTNERLIGPDERLVVVGDQMVVDDTFIDDLARELRTVGILRPAIVFEVQRLFPSGVAVGVEWARPPRVEWLDSSDCSQDGRSANIPFDHL